MDKEALKQIAREVTEGDREPELTEDVMNLAGELAALKAERKSLEDEAKRMKERENEIAKDLLPQAMANAGIVGENGKGKFTLATGETCYLNTRVIASIDREVHDEVIDWFKQNGHADLVKEDVHFQTLRSFARERLEAGEDLPAGVNLFLETYATVRKN